MDLKKVAAVIEKRWEGDESRRQSWERYTEIYEGRFWHSNMDKKLSRVDTGTLFATVAQLGPLMTDNRPVWSLTARDPVFQPVLEIWNKALTYLWDNLEMSQTINAAYMDALLMEQGVIQVGYDNDENEVSVEVVDPRHIVFPRGGYDDIQKCPWVAKRRAYTLSDVRRTYPEKSADVVADADDKEENLPRDAMNDDEFTRHNQWVTVYWLWQRDDTSEEALDEATPKGKVKRKLKYPNGRITVFTKTGKQGKPVMLDDFASPFGNGNPPFVFVYDYKLPHSIWGMGEGRHLLPIHDELNSVMQGISGKIRNTCRPNVAADPRIVDVTKVKADLHKGYQVFVKKGQEATDPRYTGIEPVPQNPPLAVEFSYIDYLNAAKEDLTSVTAIQKGAVVNAKRQTAEEWAGLYEAGHTRTRLRVRNLEWSIGRVLELVLMVAMAAYNKPRQFSERDEQGALVFRSISNSREDAIGIVKADVDQQFELQRQDDEVTQPSVYGQTNTEDAKQAAVERLIAALPDKVSPVLMRFDLVVQSQSTLPTDLQSRANMALRLYQQGALPLVELLTRLGWPNAQAIADQVEQQKAAEAGMQAGATQPQIGGGENESVFPGTPSAPGQFPAAAQ